MPDQYWEDYFNGLHAAYDEEEEDWDDYERDDWDSYCQYEYKDGKWCGYKTIGEGCEQCGKPLCPMHMETGANFCEKHPNDNYRPDYGRY